MGVPQSRSGRGSEGIPNVSTGDRSLVNFMAINDIDGDAVLLLPKQSALSGTNDDDGDCTEDFCLLGYNAL
jgi:hypothetical protein